MEKNSLDVIKEMTCKIKEATKCLVGEKKENGEIIYSKNGIDIISLKNKEHFDKYTSDLFKNVSYDEISSSTNTAIYLLKNNTKKINILYSDLLTEPDAEDLDLYRIIDSDGKEFANQSNGEQFNKLYNEVLDNKDADLYFTQVMEAEVNFG